MKSIKKDTTMPNARIIRVSSCPEDITHNSNRIYLLFALYQLIYKPYMSLRGQFFCQFAFFCNHKSLAADWPRLYNMEKAEQTRWNFG